ncbi:ABC transporter ATP-binding protein [Cutibacterium namnetense]|uniref:ABC transporter ATP-binding protein n=1 Tax=Cutibacterium namnetense TaxID=1574624 RepID=A0ABX9I9F3_9ACTN|nr:ABC transporter ATP-binding protein [Cutibacterium namnetense]REB69414.1 ABC transporter ATP-binding protein [Cutibacterium namnetense]
MLTTTRPHLHAADAAIRGADLRTLALTKTYGTTRALDHIDIAIPAGQSVAIMGPSGSGKTTLLHCLSGILSADSGTIELGLPDRTVNVENLSSEDRTKLRRQSLGFVFQQGMLVPELTAVENTALPLMLNGVSRAEAVRYAAQWLESMGLDGMADRRIGQLSGGQAQRVAIARSQVIDPAIVFADEPTGALDSATAVEVMAILLSATTGRERTLVVVTHDENVARRCQRILRLQDGRIVSDDVRHSDGTW